MKSQSNSLVLLLAFTGGLLATNAWAASDHEHSMAMGHAEAAAMAPATDGLVQKIDVAAGTLTVKHGPIANLGMPAMTMPYHVKDPSMLSAVKQGDKVRMTVEKIDGVYTIVTLQRAP